VASDSTESATTYALTLSKSDFQKRGKS